MKLKANHIYLILSFTSGLIAACFAQFMYHSEPFVILFSATAWIILVIALGAAAGMNSW